MALEVLTGRGVMHVNGVCVEDVVAVHCGRVNVLVETVGIERGVVNVADCKGYGVCGRGQEAATPAQKVLSECYLCSETEVEASAPVPAAKVHAAAPAPGSWSVGVDVVVVARSCSWGRVGWLRCFI